jgi:hypothetical protein
MIGNEELEEDRNLFRQLRRVLTRSERLWLLDCSGDYLLYRKRLKRLAEDYGIEILKAAGYCHGQSR